MTFDTAASGLLATGLAVALLFIVALLRSHAEILRRLAALEPPDAGARSRPPVAASSQLPLTEIVGETLAGDVVRLSLMGGEPRTLLAFLSSGCSACGILWDGLDSRDRAPAGARLVIVTKGADSESVTRLRRLAPAHTEVVMSTAAWEGFEVPATPHFVLVDGEAGAILGRGSATSWEQIETLLFDADADTELHQARSTSQRAARAEQALAAAGITAGDPSLYPSRGPQPIAAPDLWMDEPTVEDQR